MSMRSPVERPRFYHGSAREQRALSDTGLPTGVYFLNTDPADPSHGQLSQWNGQFWDVIAAQLDGTPPYAPGQPNTPRSSHPFIFPGIAGGGSGVSPAPVIPPSGSGQPGTNPGVPGGDPDGGIGAPIVFNPIKFYGSTPGQSGGATGLGVTYDASMPTATPGVPVDLVTFPLTVFPTLFQYQIFQGFVFAVAAAGALSGRISIFLGATELVGANFVGAGAPSVGSKAVVFPGGVGAGWLTAQTVSGNLILRLTTNNANNIGAVAFNLNFNGFKW